MAAIEGLGSMPEFDDVLASGNHQSLVRTRIETVQINLGKYCNQTCSHCHVGAGSLATEMMSPSVIQRTLKVLAASTGVSTIDITGGAPELHPDFRQLVAEVHRLGCHIIDRCNLTVLTEPGMEKIPEFLADHQVDVFASLPCYTESNVEKQRGPGSFTRSIHAIRLLNALGYGKEQSKLRLNLVYNPLGPFLPPDQTTLEEDYREQLREQFGIEFNNLLTITNMPMGRFGAFLKQSNQSESYLRLLVANFNPATLSDLMCLSMVSVGYEGTLYDCDFNQMLGMVIGAETSSIWTIKSFEDLKRLAVLTGSHCFGCTAGSGSSCGGSLQ